jgi:excisionase family DNA binding protein
VSDPSPAFRAFLQDAVRAHVMRAQREGFHPDELLRRELSDFSAWLALGSWSALTGLEETPDAAAGGSSDGSTGKRGRSTAVSRAEAASLLSLSVKSVDRLIASGALPKQKAGRRTLIAREDIESYMREAS